MKRSAAGPILRPLILWRTSKGHLLRAEMKKAKPGASPFLCSTVAISACAAPT